MIPLFKHLQMQNESSSRQNKTIEKFPVLLETNCFGLKGGRTRNKLLEKN
jgi:hypothetical protein